jgi:hypothetical protein
MSAFAASDRVLRAERARRHERSVHQEEELGGQGLRRAQARLTSQLGEAPEDLAPVDEGDPVRGVADRSDIFLT